MRLSLGLCLLALLLRLPSLGAGLWYDEIATLVDNVRLPLGELVTRYASENNHPLFSLCAWLSVHAFGEAAWSLRLPALLFGVASVAATHAVARRVTTGSEALLAAFLMVISYHHVWFSQNARGYTALLFFTLTSTWLLLRILAGRGRRAFVPYGALLGLATYAHLTAVFVALAHAVVALSRIGEARGRRLIAGLAIALGVSLVLHAGILSEMVAHLVAKTQGTALHAHSPWQTPGWTIRTVALSLGVGLLPGLIALASLAGVVIAGALSYGRQDWRLLVLFLLPGVLAGAAMLALERNLWPRFFFFLSGFLLILVARGAAVLARRIASGVAPARRAAAERGLFATAAALGIAASLLILPRAWGPKQDFVAAGRYVEQLARPGEPILTAGETDLPYQRWLEADYRSIDSLATLEEALRGRSAGYLLYTLPTGFEARNPEVARFVKEHGREVKRFPGTLVDGDVRILRLEP